MTVYQLRNRIRSLKEQIADCEGERIACRRKIERWEEVIFRVRNNRDSFEQFCCGRKSRVRSINQTLLGMAFIPSYQEDLVGIMEGKEYQQAIEGFEDAERNCRRKKDGLEYREGELEREIGRKEEELEELQKRLRYIEEE